MGELGIDKDGGSVCFGQLLGMCDHVSLTLGKVPFSLQIQLVFKCIVKETHVPILPFLA